MPVTSHEIVCYLQAPEGACFEFKEAKGGFHFEKLVEYVVALANAGGGKIILGVTDRRPRQIVGTQAFAEPGRTEAGLFDRLGHQVPIEECLPGGHRLLIVHVPAREPFRAPTNDACAGVLYLDLTSAQDRKSLREPQWAGLAGALTAK